MDTTGFRVYVEDEAKRHTAVPGSFELRGNPESRAVLILSLRGLGPRHLHGLAKEMFGTIAQVAVLPRG
jgi:hypothetical protein